MTDFVELLAVAIVGLALGLIASAAALDRAESVRPRAARSVVARAPRRLDGGGSLYAARIARSGEIPLAIGEGLQLVARGDDDGRPLDARCVYRIGPRVAGRARYWTVSLIDPHGFPVANPAERYGFRSSELLRDGDGHFAISVAAEVQPGNWLPIGAPGPFALVLTALRFPARRHGGRPSTPRRSRA